ncbi:AzlD domain-containing protein [Bibersteinia trehalosi]|uniref:AzlD domain-containing protein n=1 Tax=Bibersteinia trehalosi TaxID=47735 RepID=A0A426FK39_BIBTR|nr:AzlD domain-containing protein [Bibersteinia trehalosi]RRN05451.1 AzlD domain-containing protein [Bibersteinia trehalosi]
MPTTDILAMFAALMLGTQLCRFIPEFLPKKVLAHPILQKLNKTLPLVIMLLLVLTSLTIPHNNSDMPLLYAQLLALICVILSYKWFKNTLLSVALGIASLNGILWVFGA